jgi:hypothetical protein
VQRIELWTSVFAGASGGLFGVMWHGLVTAPWLSRGGARRATHGAHETTLQMLTAALVRTVAGVALGALYWASWGLIALVTAPWYVGGLAFGLLCWAGCVWPALATLGGSGAERDRMLRAHAVEWLATSVAIGMLCAFAWQRPS